MCLFVLNDSNYCTLSDSKQVQNKNISKYE